MSQIIALVARLWSHIKSLLTQTFSTSGLCALVALYSFFGAFIFVRLEAENERLENRALKIDVERLRNQTGRHLWSVTRLYNVFQEKKWIETTVERLQTYENNLLNTCGCSTTSSSGKWNFSGALLYSITVITTIGYGHVTCRTLLGRLATMLYALFGIPLTFLCLSNLGSLMANTFRFIYNRILCCPTSKNSRIQVPITLVIGLVFLYIFLGAFLFSIWENWGIVEGAYFCFTTLTTIGFGDFVPGTARFEDQWSNKDGQFKFVACSAYLLFGLALIAMCFNLVQEEARNKCRNVAICLGLLKTDV